MGERNLWQRAILILFVCVVGAFFLWKDKLRPGLDIAGGVAMIFEIDDKDMEGYPNLAEDVKRLLQRRVDPKGVYNLTWRVQGRNRLEVQMPLPPKQAAQYREQYDDARKDLFERAVKLSDIEQAVRLPAPERAQALRALARGDRPGAAPHPAPADPAALEARAREREKLLQAAADRYDAFTAAQRAVADFDAAAATRPADVPGPDAAKSGRDDLVRALRNADELKNDAVDAVLAQNLDPQRFSDVLELEEKSAIRQNSLKQIHADHPELAAEINVVLARYKDWKNNRGFLDGPEDLKRLLRGAGVLEFRILAEPSPENVTKYDRYRRQLEQRGTTPVAGDEYGWFKIDNPLQFFNFDSPQRLKEFDYKNAPSYVVDKRGEDYYVLGRLASDWGLLHGLGQQWQLKRASVNRDQHGKLCVNFELNVVGGQLFEDLTRRNINKALCILLDNVAYSAPNINSKIGSFGQITGDFSMDKVQYLVNSMQAGALPARLKETPLSERVIGSSLGEANRDKALQSGFIGALAVVLVMAVYYLLCGLIANFAMAMNVFLTLAVLALLGARLTLDGIAGLVLSVGMCVDANVLIYERMREERERGASLRMVIKNGFDKAFATIFDSNITTLLTCVILYYVGSEEVRGFGLTLGWGIVLNLFTAVFVTRTVFMLLMKYNLIKEIHTMKLIGVPNINWFRMKRVLVPISLFVTLGGIAIMAGRGWEDMLDVEFRGGVTADVELRQVGLNDIAIGKLLEKEGDRIVESARALGSLSVTPEAGQAGLFRVQVPGVRPAALAAMLAEPLEESRTLGRGGVARVGEDGVVFRVAEGVTGELLGERIRALAPVITKSGQDIFRASVNSVREVGDSGAAGLIWSVTTTATNKRLVQFALEEAIGENLRVQPSIAYVFRGDGDRPLPITQRRLEDVVPGLPPGTTADLTDYFGGVAMFFDQLEPPQSVEVLTTRLRNMRLQPGYQDFPYRPSKVVGVGPTGGKDENGNPLYRGAIVLVFDQVTRYSDNPEQWWTGFAQKELNLASATLQTQQSLRKVTQFKPQIAAQAQTRAILALVLSWAMIILYIWIRFGRASYGIAGVVALIHDVLVALACIAASAWIAKWTLGRALLVEDFKINMPVVAALLTIIGYSINDTIVVFDRIRETRGRLGILTPEIINKAINETLSRTIMTVFTVFVVLLAMYIFGGTSIRGFTYCMLAGVITGAYSSIAVASPLLLAHRPGRDKAAATGAVPARA